MRMVKREAARQGAPIVIPDTNSLAPKTGNKPSPQRDAEVVRLQQLLNRAGFQAGRPDGVYGPGTRRAVMAFQRSLGHTPTGILSGPERRILQTTGAGSVPVVDISQAQTLLLQLGYDVGQADGIWGARSQKALTAFRKGNGSARQGGPIGADIQAMQVALAQEEKPSRGGALKNDFVSLRSGGYRLAALPLVDREMRFHVLWDGPAGREVRIAILPKGAAPTPDSPVWPILARQAIPLTAPATPNEYDLALIDGATGEVMLRKTLEVR